VQSANLQAWRRLFCAARNPSASRAVPFFVACLNWALRMNLLTFGMILSGVLLNAGAQLLLKAGTRSLGVIGAEPTGLLSTTIAVAFQPLILTGLGCYVLSVGIWIVALSRVDVSVAYPMLSIGYVVNAFAAWWLFGEALTPMRLLGIGIILLGVIVLART
jgi:multidrug transporter EmrE-like cation transporter